jgi:tetratricopeptide (TPR) repeat protein
LEHVVYCVSTGCLALQRSTGRSHGNLKASNVLLVGKPQPLRKTPLYLVDPLPASLIHAPGLNPDERRTAEELIKEVAEVQDLHAIGLLILQLVERRLIEREDYNYPIAPSPEWNNLGKNGELWRRWCNRLLSPQLSLTDVNLESLAKAFRPGPLDNKLPLILAACAVVILVAALLLLLYKPFRSDGERQYTNVLAAAEVALGQEKWEEMLNQFEIAVELARKLKDAGKERTADEGRRFAETLSQADIAKKVGPIEDEIKRLEEATKLRNEAKVNTWLTEAKERQKQANQRVNLIKTIVRGNGLLKAGDYANAAQEFESALLLAQALKDRNQQPVAESGRDCANALIKAEAAKKGTR